MTEQNEEHNLLKGYIMMLYFSGTMIMFGPSQECIYDFWTKGILKQLPVRSSNPDFVKAAGLLKESVGKTADKYELLQEDYLRLFTGTGKPLAPPFESEYRGNEHRMFDNITSEVRNFYGKHGWESKFRNKIPDDHLGIELLFLTYLVEKFLSGNFNENKKFIPDETRLFINEHLISWVPQWNDDVQRHALTMGYKGIALLILSSIEDIDNIIMKSFS
jgi:TorA maturation chaperone TorD